VEDCAPAPPPSEALEEALDVPPPFTSAWAVEKSAPPVS
jgi:hypothetical protein